MIELMIWLVFLALAILGPLMVLRFSKASDGAGVMMALLLWLMAAVAYAVALLLRGVVALVFGV